MIPLNILSIPQQIARHLREEIALGRWAGEMPGKHALAAELETNHDAVDAALNLLQTEGLLEHQGTGGGGGASNPVRPGRKRVPSSATAEAGALAARWAERRRRKQVS